MKRDCDTPNPLLRDGSSQAQRMLRALRQDYVKVDERSLADLLGFAQRYAGELQYYNSKNEPDGDWRAFIENDISTIIALISKKDLRPIKECFEKIVPVFESSNVAEARGALKILFDLIFTLAAEMDGWYGKSVEGLQLRTELDRMITAQLQAQLKNLIANYKCADDDTGLLKNEDTVDVDACTDLQSAGAVLDSTFRLAWIIQDADATLGWREYVDSIAPDCSIFGKTTDSDHVRIQKAAPRLIAIYEAFFNAQSQMIKQAPLFLRESLETWPQHEPHIALFLAFLQLFQHAQTHLNAITRRHLDFYYKEVLQLQERPEIPDRVFVLFELAKQVNSHLLQEGTSLNAGKDATGVDVLYKIDRETAINKAKIEQLKTVFIDGQQNDRVYAAPVANSKDGGGGEFDDDEPKWKTFGESQRNRTAEAHTMQLAAIGFAMTSPILFLNEGTREIVLSLHVTNTLQQEIPNLDANTIIIQLSGEKEWIPVKPENIEITPATLLPGSQTITMTITLEAEAPPVVSCNAEVLGRTYRTHFPVLEIILRNQPGSPFAYGDMKALTVSAVDMHVAVEGVKNLIVQSDAGVLDPAKPFFPFGTSPGIDSNFYIGSAEIFQKKLTRLKLLFDWKDVPAPDLGGYYDNLARFSFTSDVLKNLKAAPELDSTVKQQLAAIEGKEFTGSQETIAFLEKTIGAQNTQQHSAMIMKSMAVQDNILSNASFQAQYSILRDKGWDNLGDDPKGLLKASDATQQHEVDFTGEFDSLTDYAATRIPEALAAYQIGTETGFIRLQLKEPGIAFGHKIFRDVYTKRIIEYATDSTNQVKKNLIPNEPYTPLLSALIVDYDAEESIDLSSSVDFEHRVSKFFHIHPFGHKEAHAQIEPQSYLFPQFRHGDVHNEGELYIGLSGLVPRQNLSMLFQVAEGSANPELPRQEVDWSYLSQNRWQPFKEREMLSDSTEGLITSGIITFDIPKAATRENTLLSTGFHWLRASVPKNSGAICDMIAIHTQAAQASFVNLGNAPGFLAQTLPAKTISKLQVKDAAVKTVSQPYASPGGKVREQGDRFYTRVSERLRHKGRGITVHDYEKLVLENFPAIYKTKCINHSTYHFYTDEIAVRRSEFAPGFVTMTVIPDLKNKNAVDPLEPRATLGVLEEIKAFLSNIISPFAARNLRVINPLYERLRLEFAVEFQPGFDRGVYVTQLNTDLKHYLSPWAYEEGRDIVFGGKIHKSVILNFVEERPYVDFVVDFKMHHIVEDADASLFESDIDEALPTTARSILVSDKQHVIHEVTNCL